MEVEGRSSIRLGSPDAKVAVWFENRERPHGDELILFMARSVGPGIHASCGVESIAGDGVGGWLRGLASAEKPWDGERRWGSLANELRLAATCDPLGHVSLRVEIQPHPSEPTWVASATLQFFLGELAALADELDRWFG